MLSARKAPSKCKHLSAFHYFYFCCYAERRDVVAYLNHCQRSGLFAYARLRIAKDKVQSVDEHWMLSWKKGLPLPTWCLSLSVFLVSNLISSFFRTSSFHVCIYSYFFSISFWSAIEVTVSACKWVAVGEEPGAWSWPVTSIYKELVEVVASEFAVRDWQQTHKCPQSRQCAF